MAKPGSVPRSTLKLPLPLIGWREWVSLPDLKLHRIKAKIDTGARTSALHAVDIHIFEQNGQHRVRFRVHPHQLDTQQTLLIEADLVERRQIRSSNGHAEVRPVILTPIQLHGSQWPVEVTLTNRKSMGFRLLLGRQSLRDRFWVDPGRSFLVSDQHSGKPSETINLETERIPTAFH